MKAIAIIQDIPQVELLPREVELALPGRLKSLRKIGHIDYGTGFANRGEFYDKMIQRTNQTDGCEIFQLNIFESALELIGKGIIDLSIMELIDKPRNTFQLSNLEENNFDWV